ncbi:hypothetical protein SAMN05720487_11416 [Fibrobacter sp. UWT2]|uniref:hypothetical protein n=1 Tax=Fibrobacter sp. UWT2 TaxID=1896224 RepID=UPI000919CB49|nr:hypothetical protein [Fibrobacter sp. UWT2]SHL44373.1 hypothetical protein SAMN05720487_11416 [Fibrobacter sp. UWT2]
MKHNNRQATQIANLVTLAKYGANADIRQQAVNDLWDICGEQISGVMLKNSYKVDSDREYHDMTPEKRNDDIFDKAYIAFREWVDSFDPSFGVPFLAYTSQKSGWLMQDDKRKNSKRCKRVDVFDPNGVADDDEKGRSSKPKSVEESAIFKAMLQSAVRGYDCSDAKVAEKIGCTRANTGVLHKKMLKLLKEEGLDEEFRQLMAA